MTGMKTTKIEKKIKNVEISVYHWKITVHRPFPLFMYPMRAFTSLATSGRRAILTSRNMRSIAMYTTQAQRPNSIPETDSSNSPKTHFGFRDVLESEKEQLGMLLDGWVVFTAL
jgi:hypothetical protein